MKVVLSEKAGYCFGVQRAMNKAESLLDQKGGEKIYSFGSLIHNDQATGKLAAKGLREANSVSDIEDGSVVIIRSHGLGKKYYELLEEKNCRIEDATCPFVKKIQNIALSHKKVGKKIIIIGDGVHPEIEGINLWAGGDCIIGKELEEFEKISFEEEASYVVVTQTTFNVEKYRLIKAYLESRLREVVFFDTICDATKERQEDAVKIAREVDAMLVIGGKQSSNTKKLYELCSEFCKTFLIETVKDIDVDEIKFYDSIGVTAGASTPDFIIDEVVAFIVHIKKHGKELGLMSSEMEKLLLEEEQNYEEVYKGSIVKGYVERVKPDSYYITLNYKTDGVLPKTEMNGDEELQVGDEVSLEVIKIDKNTGEIILSKKRLDAFKAWDDLEIGKVIDVKVAEIGNKGLIAKYKNSIKGFIPLSHVANKFVKDEDLQEFQNQEFQTEIIDVEPRKRRLILSRKNILAREEQARKDEFVKNLAVGDVYTGTVRDIKNYGMFVDLGAMTGLVHISELSWNRRDKIEQLYSVGDSVEVKVVEFDAEKGRLSLSIKALQRDPFEVFQENTKVDDIIECTVKNIKEYGIFVKLNEDVDGFIHISNLSSSYVKNPAEIVNQGDVLSAKIISINPETQKIELTLNLNEEKEEVSEEVPQEATVVEEVTEEGTEE